MEAHLRAAQQYFPTYKLDPKRTEIGLREYDLAAKALEADQRSLTAAAGMALFFGGGAATILSSGNVLSPLTAIIDGSGIRGLITLSSVILIVALLLTHYFARLQISATYAARKIVVLRRLLGLDYGNIETVLPADTLDGANEPFAIAMFPGWTSLQAIPELAVALLSGLAQAILLTTFHRALTYEFAATAWGAPLTGVLMTVVPLVFYRLSLFEDYENVRFFCAQKAAVILRVPLKRRVGHALYRIRLAIFEATRLKIDLSTMHPMLVHIEDRQFYHHNGNSVKAALAAAWRYFRHSARSGGSTILQQLARSNFLTRFRPKFRRKIVEWLLAPWLNKQFEKPEALNAYLVSVRYAHGVFGLAEAIKYYFPNYDFSDAILPHMQFILIERLSNVSRSFPEARIQSLVRSCKQAGLLSDSDIVQLNSAYNALGRVGKIDLKGISPALQ